MPFHPIATVAAAWSGDRNGAFLMEFDAAPALWAGYDQGWALFVPAMQVIADCGDDNEIGGWAQYTALVDHEQLGRYVVSWSSHMEGRGPCFVQVLQVGDREAVAVAYPGPAEGAAPTGLLEQLINEGLWQYPGELPGGE
jgi:hypothetical protein